MFCACGGLSEKLCAVFPPKGGWGGGGGGGAVPPFIELHVSGLCVDLCVSQEALIPFV